MDKNTEGTVRCDTLLAVFHVAHVVVKEVQKFCINLQIFIRWNYNNGIKFISHVLIADLVYQYVSGSWGVTQVMDI